MAIYKFANNFRTTLSTGINNSITTIVLTSSAGLPSIGAGEVYSLSISDGTNIEEVTVTDDASAPSLTVTRNADSRGAHAFAAGSIIECRPTSTQQGGFVQKVNGLQGSSITLAPGDIISGYALTSVTVAANDKIVIQDTSNSDNVKSVTAQGVRDLAPTAGTTGTGAEVRADSPTFTTLFNITSAGDTNFNIKSTSATGMPYFNFVRNTVDQIGAVQAGTNSTGGASGSGMFYFNGVTNGPHYFFSSTAGNFATLAPAGCTLTAITAPSINFGDENLSHYDEGTFTPAITFATVGDLSVVYTSQVGKYTRVGNQVFVSLRVVFTPTFTTSASYLRFTGLPFTASSALNNYAGTFYYQTALSGTQLNWGTGMTQLGVAVDSNTNFAYVTAGKNSSATSAIDATLVTSGSQYYMDFSVTYLI